jgi:hypothetical protein
MPRLQGGDSQDGNSTKRVRIRFCTPLASAAMTAGVLRNRGTMDLIAPVAIVGLSLAVGVSGTRAILEVMYACMMHQRFSPVSAGNMAQSERDPHQTQTLARSF